MQQRQRLTLLPVAGREAVAGVQWVELQSERTCVSVADVPTTLAAIAVFALVIAVAAVVFAEVGILVASFQLMSLYCPSLGSEQI
jgi:hypothetical protein